MNWKPSRTKCGVGNLALSGGVVHVDGTELRVTAFEYRALEAIAEADGYIETGAAVAKIYVGRKPPPPDSLRVLVSRLRRKLRDAGATAAIDHRRGLGYRLAPLEELP